MNEFQFADRYLGNWKQRGNEIVAERCVVCNGGSHKDKHTMYLNIDKHTYICHRGSCGASGTFKQLAEQFGEEVDYMQQNRLYDVVSVKKDYTKPSMPLTNCSEQGLKYLKLRGINEDTINHFGVCSDNQGNIVFPYINEDGEHELNKIRIPRKFIKGQDKTKIWQEGGGRPILFGMHKADTSNPLLITEGEWDCMSCYESGFHNVVSVPFGTNNMDWITECWNWLEQFAEIILWYDNDKAGKQAITEVLNRLGKYRCRIVKDSYNDANIALHKESKGYVLNRIQKAEFVPLQNVRKMSEVEDQESTGSLFGVKFLDYWLGGCLDGNLIIWTGKRGGAKSTILQQTIGDCIERKQSVFLMSAELKNVKQRTWLERQFAKESELIMYKNPLTSREEYKVDPRIASAMRKWYDNYLHTYDDKGDCTDQELLDLMGHLYQRYGIKRHIIDNLKTIKLTGKGDKWEKQAYFVKRCKDLCNTYGIHIDLVVHPSKTKNKEEMDDEDVGGLSDIIDLADGVIECKKVAADKVPEEAAALGVDVMAPKGMTNWLTRLRILKNREYGDTEVKQYYKFNVSNKRIESKNGFTKQYGFYEYLEDVPMDKDGDILPF